jgi:hypothetical protein
VKLLFDQNLSRFLVERVGDEFKGSLHVIHLGLDQATDREIWEWAGEHGFTIVSKDSDFRDLAASSVPPRRRFGCELETPPLNKSNNSSTRIPDASWSLSMKSEIRCSSLICPFETEPPAN